MTQGALQGLRILDLSRVLAGPLCTMMLADMGAEVIKIEEPIKGDDTRRMGPFQKGESGYYMNLNRNKLGMTLNLKKPEGRELFLKMIQKADAVVENYRPGTMDKLGLGWEVLHRTNPGLVYAAISGFGQTGRYREKAGYDIIAQAMSGMMSTTGWPMTGPTRTGTAITDVLAGLSCAVGLLAALRNRDRSGQGQMVDIALVDCGVAGMEVLNMLYLMSGTIPGLHGNRYPVSYPFDSFRAQDGLFVIGVSNNSLWAKLCGALGRPEVIDDPQFRENDDRVRNHRLVKQIVESWTSLRSVAECCAHLEMAGVPCGPILSVDQVTADPHIAQDRQMFVEQNHPVAGKLAVTGSHIKLSATPPEIRTPAPTLGQHTEQIINELFPDGAACYDQLLAAGVF